MLNPLHLRTLVEVVRAGSFAKAARNLGYTASAVSQQMAALERATKLNLFEREAQRIKATPAAEYFALHAPEVIAALGTLDYQLQAFIEGRGGRLRLGSFPTAGVRLVPGAIAAFQKRHPGVRLSLDEGEPEELLALLQLGELDIALVYQYDRVPRGWPRGLRRVALFNEKVRLLLPDNEAPGNGLDPVRLIELSDSTWITSREGTAGATNLLRICADHGFEPRIAFRTNNYDVTQELVASGLGVALVPQLALQTPRDHIRCVSIAPTSRPDGRQVLALARERQLDVPLNAFVAELRRTAAPIATWS